MHVYIFFKTTSFFLPQIKYTAHEIVCFWIKPWNQNVLAVKLWELSGGGCVLYWEVNWGVHTCCLYMDVMNFLQVMFLFSLFLQLEAVSSPAHLNAHLPQRLLLASCQLRLAHAHQLQVNRLLPGTRLLQKTESMALLEKRKIHLDAATVACRHALQLVSESVLPDPCLAAELNSTYGNVSSHCFISHNVQQRWNYNEINLRQNVWWKGW